MRTCNYCGTDFERTLKSRSVLCLPCRRKHEKQWRAKRKATGDPVVSTPNPAGYMRRYRKQNLVKMREADARYDRIRIRKPTERPKVEARWKLNRAIASGKVTRKPCSVCGNKRSQGHHEDYAKPLQVIWLCRLHHDALHNQKAGAL